MNTPMGNQNKTRSLDEIVADIIAWQRETFAGGTEEGRIAHWKKEIDEFLADPSSGEEASDVFFLFIAITSNRGIDLAYEADRKLAINKAREWIKNAEGFSEHVREPDVSPDIDWPIVPDVYNFAFLRPDSWADRGFVWVVSAVMPRKAANGYHGIYEGVHTRIWDGESGVAVRDGVDFREILRVRPGFEILQVKEKEYERPID